MLRPRLLGLNPFRRLRKYLLPIVRIYAHRQAALTLRPQPSVVLAIPDTAELAFPARTLVVVARSIPRLQCRRWFLPASHWRRGLFPPFQEIRTRTPSRPSQCGRCRLTLATHLPQANQTRQCKDNLHRVRPRTRLPRPSDRLSRNKTNSNLNSLKVPTHLVTLQHLGRGKRTQRLCYRLITNPYRMRTNFASFGVFIYLSHSTKQIVSKSRTPTINFERKCTFYK